MDKQWIMITGVLYNLNHIYKIYYETANDINYLCLVRTDDTEIRIQMKNAGEYVVETLRPQLAFNNFCDMSEYPDYEDKNLKYLPDDDY
tara:strand:+ start:431 stop:697 length:267 start_codon:yes stop_codon:yes gene_type:complete